MRTRHPLSLVGVLLFGALLTGCATVGQRVGGGQPVVLDHATSELPEQELLDVWIEVFEPGPISEDEAEAYGITPEIRGAEARFIPVHLKKTLQQTGYWGAVRVVPEGTEGVEIRLRGRILVSDGETLSLHIRVTDSTNRDWLVKTYEALADTTDYGNGTSRDNVDAFQNLYNAIANDLAALKEKMLSAEKRRIRQVAELRFAEDMAPEVFDGYLEGGKDGYVIRRLPARGDPMLQRVRAIRERDYLLVDTINDHYDTFYSDLWEPYENWRKFRAEEAANLRKIEREALTRKALGIGAVVGAIALSMAGGRSTLMHTESLREVMVIGGVVLAKSGFDKDSEKQIHIDALEELGTSFESEASPMVVEVEGETHRLTGSVEAQYTKWRELLYRIHATETGFTPELN